MEKKNHNNNSDKLARMIKGGFDDVDKKLNKLEICLGKKIDDLQSTLTTQYPDKSFLTESLAQLGEDIDKKFQKDIKFKIKVIEVLKQLDVSNKDISELQNLVDVQINNYAAK